MPKTMTPPGYCEKYTDSEKAWAHYKVSLRSEGEVPSAVYRDVARILEEDEKLHELYLYAPDLLCVVEPDGLFWMQYLVGVTFKNAEFSGCWAMFGYQSDKPDRIEVPGPVSIERLDDDRSL